MDPEAELTLNDMLADPIVHLVMQRDGLDEAELRALIHKVAQRLRQAEPRSFAARPVVPVIQVVAVSSRSLPRRMIMKVSEAMTREVRLANPNDRICDAARIMGEIDAGAVPVGENDRLVGMITDRDIAVRAVGANRGPDTPVRDIMTKDLQYCFDDEDISDVCAKLADQQLRRLPVVNRDKRLVGILSLGDLAKGDGADQAARALSGISQPGGTHSQNQGEARVR
jgi:CBS domain-containing protein